MRSQRVKAFRIHPETIVEILTSKGRPLVFPDGIEVERFGYQWETNSAIVILSHPDWPKVEEGQQIDIRDLLLQPKYDS